MEEKTPNYGSSASSFKLLIHSTARAAKENNTAIHIIKGEKGIQSSKTQRNLGRKKEARQSLQQNLKDEVAGDELNQKR